MTFDKLIQLVLEGDARRSYSCLMLECQFLSEHIRKIQSQIDPDDVWDEEPGHGLETHYHITVLYGIHSNIPSEVYDKLDLQPVEFKLTGISMFENEKYDVLKFAVKSNDLHKLNTHCKDNIAYTSSYPTYIPHLTIAYLKPGTAKKYQKLFNDIPELRQTFQSNKFTFSDQLSQKVEWTV